MAGAKFDIKKFDGTGDFGLWRIKMRALLIQHGCEATLEEIKERSKAKGDDGEGLYVRGKLIRKGFTITWKRKLSDPKNNRKKSTGYVKKDKQPSSSGSTYDDSEVMMVMSAQAHALLDWIMDSRCSYHMKPRGIGKVRIQLKDGSSFVLYNVRYIPELKRNLISLGTLKKEGFTVKLQSGKVNVINGSRVVLSRIRMDNCVYSLDGHAMAGIDYFPLGIYYNRQLKEDSFMIIMDAAAMKHMASNFAKLDKFEGVDFRRWQKKMHFLLSSMSVVYVLTTPIPEDGGDDPTVEQVKKRAKWDNDDYVCRGLILNGMSDSLFDIYQNVESFKELWDSLEAKYMVEDASSKKFLVSNFTNYKITDSRPVGTNTRNSWSYTWMVYTT
ncbi:hypothetical protein Tco_0286334 [Tanacetum coccineum]